MARNYFKHLVLLMYMRFEILYRVFNTSVCELLKYFFLCLNFEIKFLNLSYKRESKKGLI